MERCLDNVRVLVHTSVAIFRFACLAIGYRKDLLRCRVGRPSYAVLCCELRVAAVREAVVEGGCFREPLALRPRRLSTMLTGNLVSRQLPYKHRSAWGCLLLPS